MLNGGKRAYSRAQYDDDDERELEFVFPRCEARCDDDDNDSFLRIFARFFYIISFSSTSLVLFTFISIHFERYLRSFLASHSRKLTFWFNYTSLGIFCASWKKYIILGKMISIHFSLCHRRQHPTGFWKLFAFSIIFDALVSIEISVSRSFLFTFSHSLHFGTGKAQHISPSLKRNFHFRRT